MDISMPRGDIRPVRFTINNGTESVEDFDEIYFTVKANFRAREYIFQKRLSNGTIYPLNEGGYGFVIEPDDTNSLAITNYVFDIEVVRGAEVKQTFIGTLKITNEVTFAANEV